VQQQHTSVSTEEWSEAPLAAASLQLQWRASGPNRLLGREAAWWQCHLTWVAFHWRLWMLGEQGRRPRAGAAATRRTCDAMPEGAHWRA
jgi:hypothetical protein